MRSPALRRSEPPKVTNIINYWIRWSFPIGVLMGLVIASANIYRIVRLKFGSRGALVLRAT